MTKAMKFRIVLMIGAAFAASGCSILKRGGKPKTPVLGERIAVLTSEGDVAVDPETAAIPMTLPDAVANTEWTQSGGSASKSVGQVALGTALAPAFHVQAGRGSSLTARLASEPVVAGGRVYTIDTLGAVRSFDAQTGALQWASQTPYEERNNTPALYGGGIAYDNGRIYATNGIGYVSAIDVRTGGIVWKVRPGGPLRGAPTVAGDTVYVMSQDNQIYSLKEADGTTNWSQAAALEIAGVFGSASPAVGQGTVVAGFSSGELNAYRYENGRSLWQDALSRTSISTAVASLADVDADPVIDGGVVYAIGQGGRMVALELVSGQRLWEINVAGISTPWVAGDWLFVITDDARLMCIARASGKVRWISVLPRWDNEKKKKGLISWHGPILAGGRLIVASSDGRLANIDPLTGNLQSKTKVGDAVDLPPIVANDTLFVLTAGGKLIAWR